MPPRAVYHEPARDEQFVAGRRAISIKAAYQKRYKDGERYKDELAGDAMRAGAWRALHGEIETKRIEGASLAVAQLRFGTGSTATRLRICVPCFKFVVHDQTGFAPSHIEVLASAVGLPFGLVVSSLARSPKIVAPALLISFSARIGLGTLV